MTGINISQMRLSNLIIVANCKLEVIVFFLDAIIAITALTGCIKWPLTVNHNPPPPLNDARRNPINMSSHFF